MEYTVLGSTGLRVSRIGFGVYSVTGMYGETPREKAVDLIRAAYEMGVNFFDTADVYGYGLGEELLCEALGKKRLEEVVVATKIGYDFYSSRPPRRRYEPAYLIEAAGRSLERLCGVPPALLQLHNPPLEALAREETWQALAEIRDRGLALHTGVALGPEIDVLPHAREALRHPETEALQMVYNILEQEPGATIAKLAREKGVGTIARVPHAGGVLDETIDPLEAEKRRPGDHRGLRRPGWYAWAARAYAEMKPVLGKLPGTPAQRAIRAILDTGLFDAVVVVARSKGQLREHLGALDLPPVPRSVLERLRVVYARHAPLSPEKPRELNQLLDGEALEV